MDTNKGPYLITFPVDKDGITTTVVWHPLLYSSIENYIKDSAFKVEQLIDGKLVIINNHE